MIPAESILKSSTTPGSTTEARHAVRFRQDLNQSLLALLGVNRLARTSGGDLEGLVLNAQEFVLMTLVYYLVAEPPAPSKAPLTSTTPVGSVPGAVTSSAAPGTSGGSTAPSGSAAAGWSGSASGSRQATVSSTYERLLLAHLHAYLPHRQYEVARAQESRSALLLTRLFHEFLIEQSPSHSSASSATWLQSSGGRRLGDVKLGGSLRIGPFGSEEVLQCFGDARLQPAALHAVRLVLLHVLANPCLRQGCEETAERLMWGRAGGARITRELALLGPAVVQMLCELLRKLQSQKEVGLEAISSLTRLWLILLQPWKAPRLHEWYGTLRPCEPRLEPPAPWAFGIEEEKGIHGAEGFFQASRSAASSLLDRSTRPVDVALLGLEPEVSGEPPVPQAVPKRFLEEDTNLAVHASTRLAAAAGLTSAAVTLASTAQASTALVPGEGDAMSWRSYVGGFQGAYFLLEAILTTPLHSELCLELCRFAAGDRGAWLARARDTTARAAGGNWGNAPAPTAQQLLRQRNAIQALKTLAQTLLCFSDPQLLQVLREGQPQLGLWLQEHGLLLELPMRPIFEELPPPQLLSAVALTWAALLGAASVTELQPLLAAVSRQLQHAQPWAQQAFPALEASETARRCGDPRREMVLKEFGQWTAPDAASRPMQTPSAPSAMPALEPPTRREFAGSEWQRPIRGGELEQLLVVAYYLANAIDRMLGRGPRLTPCGPVPQTEWPRMFGNWKFSLVLCILASLAKHTHR
ncbi:Glutathione S-transferase 1 [Durusdinium trenchii]|uniref:Glutathione S-transferase 1 n=1 Tax=Durusdinium trenchii TaxID=1381693 RepID=A0ABP0KX71_9DINO